MRVRQYVYFGIASEALTPDAISAAVGLQPDESRPKGSRRPGPPPIPRRHLWKLRSGVPETADLNDHFAALVAKLAGYEDRIEALLDTEDADGGFQVVRHFDPGPEDEAIIEPGRLVDGFERLRGQHPLLSFHLEEEWLAVAVKLGGGIDFDEYGDEYE